MALFSFQSGRKAVENGHFLFGRSGNEAAKIDSSFLSKATVKRREIFPVKQGKYREKQGIYFKL